MKDVANSLILIMHFEKGMQQQEIAAKLGLSKMTVSRMIQKAREDGLVQINIKLPFRINESLGKRMMERYALSEAVVVKGDSKNRKKVAEALGQVCAFHLGILVADDSILGLGLGATIGQLIRYLVPMKSTNIHIVQLIGGLEDVAYTNPFTIVQEACRKWKAEGTYFAYPAIVLSKDQRDSILFNAPFGKKMTSMWEQCATAVFGVGTIENGYLSHQLVTPDELEHHKKLGIVGDILGHCFNQKGDFVATGLADRLVSIPLDLLKKVPERIAVAGGIEKARALKALLSVGMVTTLFIDENTARTVLEDDASMAIGREN